MIGRVKVELKDSIIHVEINHLHESLKGIKDFIKEHFEEFFFSRSSIVLYQDLLANAEDNKKREKLIQWIVKHSNLERLNPTAAQEIIGNFKKQIKIKIAKNDIYQDITTIRLICHDSRSMMIEVKKDTINIILNYIKTRFLFHLVRYEKDHGRILISTEGKGFDEILKTLLEKKSIAGKRVMFLYERSYIDSLIKQSYRRREYQKNVDEDIRQYMAKIKNSYTMLRLDSQVRDLGQIKRQYYKLAKRFHPDNYYNHPESTVKYYENQFMKVKEAYETLKEYVEKKSA